jgi:hypothetical protein
VPPSELAALRGEPSYVWRSGQERRLRMIATAANLYGASVLVDGCGLGSYAAQIGARFKARMLRRSILSLSAWQSRAARRRAR